MCVYPSAFICFSNICCCRYSYSCSWYYAHRISREYSYSKLFVWFKRLYAGTLCNPLKVNTVCGLVVAVLQAVTVIGIPIAILFIVWAGLRFVLAQGNPGKLEEARSNFLNVLIGIALFAGAALIANVIMNTLASLGAQGINSC